MQTNWDLIDFSRVEVVSYDLGYTVVGLNTHQVAKLINEHLRLPTVTPVQVHLADLAMRRDAMASKDRNLREQTIHYADILCLMLDYLFPGHQRKLILSGQIEEFHEACRAYHDDHNFFDQIYSDALAAIQFLHQHGVRMIVISNAHGTLDRDLNRFGLSRFFEHILDSAAEGVSKPDPEIFVRAVDRVAVAAENVLHIGDNPHADIQGALAIGMQAALYDPVGMFPDIHGHAPQFRNHIDLAEQLVSASASSVRASTN